MHVRLLLALENCNKFETLHLDLDNSFIYFPVKDLSLASNKTYDSKFSTHGNRGNVCL